ncbi:Regulatory protein RepA [Roseovarius sp. THAF27]|uniref:AAA family ATPase n=1 Tax=Roseovarius sp. THAF27 TaxID=2587850 RepID=UPI0012AA84A4|nr:AAA family ATPase [Roseovarius sp. THAF27]QFT81875.1 Regulatory protein RepA [Roseovarius sp. THAF27]
MDTPDDTTTQDNLSAALALAADGITVFPVGPNKRPLVKGWQDKATADPDQIEAWWSKWPDAMPALPTGKRNGVAVLDVDRKNGKDGFAELAALGLDVDALSDTQGATANDGAHLYFRWSEGITNSPAGLPPGLDVRGEGGFVVAPGAVNGNGVYKLLKGSLTGKLPPWPEALPIRRKATEPGEARPTGLPWPVFVEAVRAVPNDINDRESWVARLAAIHAESGGGSNGLELAHEWSAQHKTYDPTETDRVWASFKRSDGATGWRFIAEAERRDWSHPDVAELRQAEAVALLEDAWTTDQMAEIERESVKDRMDRLADSLKLGDAQRALIGGRIIPYFTDVADLLSTAAPPREWHVDDWIPAKTVHMLGGPGGTGKSLLAIQLAVATACGLPWIGMDVLKPGPVLYYGAEDDQDEMHRRFADVCHAEGVKPGPGRIRLRAAVAEDTIFATLDRTTGKVQPTDLVKRIEAEAVKVRPSLLVLDTLANLHALDPNSQEQARAFVSLLIGIAQRCGCTVLLLAHPSRTGMADGSGDGFSVAWSNSVRSRSYLASDDSDADLRVLKGMKSNYGKSGQEITLRWEQGAFQPVKESVADSYKDRAVFLAVFDRLFAQGRYLSHKISPTYAPARVAEEEEARAANLSNDRLRDAMNALLASDVLVIETYKNGSRHEAQRLARGPGQFTTGGNDDLL